MLWLGIYLLFSPLIYVVKLVPFVGWLISNGVSFIVGVFALLLGTTLTLLTISVAWIVYRPLIGIALLAAVGLGVGTMFLVKA
jgi:hypothetical protein